MRATTPPSSLRGCPSCGMSPKRYSLPQITLISTRKVSKNLDMSHKKIIFSLYKTTTTIMSNTMVAVNMKIVLCMWECVETGLVHFWCNLLGTKKVYKIENQIFVDYSLRRALDSNQRIPYDIGSLANCWFKPLTQPSLNHLFVKERCKYTTNFLICKIY